MPTSYVFDSQNTREIATGDALTLLSGDTLLVELGGLKRQERRAPPAVMAS
jgi:hypothetical protein